MLISQDVKFVTAGIDDTNLGKVQTGKGLVVGDGITFICRTIHK